MLAKENLNLNAGPQLVHWLLMLALMSVSVFGFMGATVFHINKIIKSTVKMSDKSKNMHRAAVSALTIQVRLNTTVLNI